MFAKTWPERSRRLFVCFDPVIQRVYRPFLSKELLYLILSINT